MTPLFCLLSKYHFGVGAWLWTLHSASNKVSLLEGSHRVSALMHYLHLGDILRADDLDLEVLEWWSVFLVDPLLSEKGAVWGQ